MDTSLTGGLPFTQAKQIFIIYLKCMTCSSAVCDYGMGNSVHLSSRLLKHNKITPVLGAVGDS